MVVILAEARHGAKAIAEFLRLLLQMLRNAILIAVIRVHAKVQTVLCAVLGNTIALRIINVTEARQIVLQLAE
jgi:hypothetical protein